MQAMPRDGSKTRDKLLDAAQALVLQQGFSATTVERVIDRAGVTKGTFFYHFATKDDLARALVDRWARWDHDTLESALARASELSKDPVQRLLILVGLLAEGAEQLSLDEPGCLFASYCYESGLFSDEVHQVISDGFARWQHALTEWIEAAAAARPPRAPVEVADVAALLVTTFEGGLILARISRDPDALARQLRQYRTYLELLFAA